MKKGAQSGIPLSLAILILAPCASFEVRKQGTANYGNRPFLIVWNAALKSLHDMSFGIKGSKKEKIGLPAYRD
ncbi:MAG: hypothetical protein ACUVV5_05180 [Candidatus Aminicenantales bacterium]